MRWLLLTADSLRCRYHQSLSWSSLTATETMDAYLAFALVRLITGRGGKGGWHLAHLRTGHDRLAKGIVEEAPSTDATSDSDEGKAAPVAKGRTARSHCKHKGCKVSEHVPRCPSCRRPICIAHRPAGAAVVAAAAAAAAVAPAAAGASAALVQPKRGKKMATVVAAVAEVPTAADACDACFQGARALVRVQATAASASAAAEPAAAGAVAAVGAGAGAAEAAQVNVVVPDTLTDAEMRTCWAYLTGMSYPNLAHRFDVVRVRLRDLLLQAARSMAAPTWPCGQRDLLHTLLHTDPWPVWYAGGARAQMLPVVAAEAAGAGGGESRDISRL